MIKNLRIIVWLIFVISSIFLIISFDRKGLIVISVSENLSEMIKPGDIIYEINGKEAKEEDLVGFVTLKTNRGEFDVNINRKELLVEKRPSTNLKFGLDIRGGVIAIVKPEKNISEDVLEVIKTNLERRMSSLRESVFQIVRYENKSYIQIQIAGGTEDEIIRLINTTGVFEAKIPIPVYIYNSSGIVKFGNENEWFEIKLSEDNNAIIIDNKKISINETFSKNDIKFTLWKIENIANGSIKVYLSAIVFENSGENIDVIRVYTDAQHSYVQKVGDYYEWQFDIEVSKDGSERFYKAVKNLGIRYEGSRSYLESNIYLYLDGKEITNLSISSSLKNKPTTSATVSGAAPTKEEAIEEKKWLQTILRSGALPTSLEIVSLNYISPKLGENFLQNVILALFASIIFVSLIILMRYKNLRISIPALIISFSEVIILLGASVLINWNLDLASIAGIIIIVGTGVDQQIMIIDETLSKKEELSLKAKIKRAFFMIATSAGTTIGAMIPLFSVGFGLLRGFAITTILGILIAIFVTRPAFTEILQNLLKD
ncbi:MAG: hypothetical protein QXZ20_03175 [Candidatus Aenigmatarchaeota archaeon]